MRSLVAVAALLVVASCGTSAPDAAEPSSDGPSSAGPQATGPAAAVEELMRALDGGECASAQDLVVTPSELGCDVVELAAGSFADEGIDLDDVTYESTSVEGSSSTVTIDWGNGDPHESYDVERVDGTWLVVFDSAA